MLPESRTTRYHGPIHHTMTFTPMSTTRTSHILRHDYLESRSYVMNCDYSSNSLYGVVLEIFSRVDCDLCTNPAALNTCRSIRAVVRPSHHYSSNIPNGIDVSFRHTRPPLIVQGFHPLASGAGIGVSTAQITTSETIRSTSPYTLRDNVDDSLHIRPPVWPFPCTQRT